jgi:hypothetical protein
LDTQVHSTHVEGARVSSETHTARWLAVQDDVVREATRCGCSEADIEYRYAVSPAEQRRIVRAGR